MNNNETYLNNNVVTSNSTWNNNYTEQQHSPTTSAESSRPTPAEVWGFGLLFVTIISCSAAVGIALMPCLSKRTYNRVLIYFVGLGVGSLSGSAVFHLLPQAFGIVDPPGDHTHSYIIKCWVAIGGIYLFFLVDKFIKLFTEWKRARKAKLHYHKHNEAQGKLGNSSSLHSEASYTTIATADSGRPLSTSDTKLQDSLSASTVSMQVATKTATDNNNQPNGGCGHDHSQFLQGKNVIATVAWMIIFGDGLHNFVDGLSIGAAFTESVLSGISISVAVVCEEFPHELGDVAILIASGMTLRQALFYNLLSAATCYLGFIIGVLVGELSEASVYIFAFAGGMFLYISLGNMVPEMNNTMEKALQKNVVKAFYVLLVQSAGILTGVTIMFLMSYFGDQITFK